MLTILKKIISYLLSLLLAFAVPAQTISPARNEGQSGFWLAAVTANRVLIEPEFVPAKSGDTIRGALQQTAHTWEGLDEGYLYAVDGTQANYVLFTDDGGCDLNAPASSITALLIGVNSVYSPALMALLRAMGAYRTAENGVQNFPAAQAAYAEALDGLRSADEAAAQRLLESLNDAVGQYEAILNGEKYHVAFSASAALRGTLTDAYGNVTAIQNGAADVPAGSYAFSVFADETRRTEGTVSVAGDLTVPVELPTGAWFGEVQLLDAEKNAYPSEQKDHETTVSVPDYIGGTGVYLFAQIGDVPNANTTALRARYVDTDGADKSSVPRSWNSRSVSLTNLLSVGMQGKTFTLEAAYPDAKGFTQIETHTVSVRRVPTLTSLQVVTDGVNALFPFERDNGSYTVPAASESVTIRAAADEAYTVTIDGEKTSEKEIETDSAAHTVTVAAQGQTNAYTIQLQKKNGVQVTLLVPEGTTAELQTQSGEALTPSAEHTYTVVPGVAYRYVATKDAVYHASAAVIAAENMTVAVAEPDCADALLDFALYDRSNASTRKAYAPDAAFDPTQHSAACLVPDTASVLYAQATAAQGYAAFAVYRTPSADEPKSVAVGDPVSASGAATYLSGALTRGGAAQTVTLRLSRTVGDTEFYQDYTVKLYRSLHLASLEISAQNNPLPLQNESGELIAFDRDRTDYTVFVPQETQSVRVAGSFPADGGYTLTVNDKELTDGTFPLDVTKTEETAQLCVHHTDKTAQSGIYTVHFIKVSAVALRFLTTPQDACVFLTRRRDGQRVSQQDGAFPVIPGEAYTYTVTANGYVGQQVDDYIAPQSDTVLTVTLEKAPAGSALPQFDAAWPSFRADRFNNGVTNAKIPTEPQDAALYWAAKIGDGYSADACGCPILVDGALYTYAGTTLYKIDAASGEVLQTGRMHHSSSFAINTPTYADGMLFVGLSDGAVQAFNAETLESLWLYTDPLGGQPNSPITYADGFIYTGFWQGETLAANYVCLSVTDEDPTSPEETKLACWTFSHTGGFYWSGAYVTDSAVVIATDDGMAGYTKGFAEVVSLDRRTGQTLGSVTMPRTGDIRSGVMYDRETDACYFTSKGGWFGKLRLLPNGAPNEASLQLLTLQNGSDAPAMSTSTPTVYNGRAYIGVCGGSQFGLYAGHSITVIDLAHMEIAYSVPTRGYPQTSGVLTTAYDEGDGTVFVYFIDNYTPGKIRVLRDKPGQTRAYRTETEQYTIDGQTYSCDAAPVLFTPFDAHAQYAICSPVADADGTLYFKNDSGYLFAVGSAPQSLTVTAQPNKTTYTEGEALSAQGLRVTASFANGTVRDVTKYIRFSTDPLTADDTDFRIVYPLALYHDGDRGPGTRCSQPIAVLSLQIQPRAVQGDVDLDGRITTADGDLVWAYHNAELTLTAQQLARADRNGDGRVNALDAAMIYATVNGTI